MAITREQNGVSATRRFIVPVAGLMLVVGAMMIAVILYSARKMDENIVSAQTELIDNSINARLTRSLSELRSVAWWDEAVTKSRGTTFDPGLARPRGRRVHDRELPPRPDHDPRRAGPPRLRLRRREPHRGGAAARRPRRGPRPGRARSAAAATSRRASPTPPSPATPSKATSAAAATAAAPPRSSRSAIMASSPR